LKTVNTVILVGIILIGCLLLASGTAAGAGIQSYLGDTIALQGYSYESSTVYLFLTGPNLPVNGVALDNINARADQGYFTQVDVDGNGHWEYNWGTNSMGGRLDAGTYTVWVVNGPNDRSHLSEAEYSTITVTLSSPGLTANIGTSGLTASLGTSGLATNTPTPMIPGSMVLSSYPNESSVVVNNGYKGRTPLTLEGLEPGTYNVTFSRFGYYKLSTPVKVESGSVSEVTASLVQETGGLAINTSPAGARVMIDGADAGFSPFISTNLSVGNHTINVSYAGYISKEQPVNVIVNQTQAVNLVLSPVSTWAAGLVPATLLAGVIVVLLVGIYRSRHH
jgi:hypothetical protein